MLTSNEIARLLESIGCTKKHETQYAIGYTLPSTDQYIYVNKKAGENYSGLVIHPRHQSFRDNLMATYGVQSQQKYIHKSNMKMFPKKQNKGKKEICYGMPFGFDSEAAFRNFIEQLLTHPIAYFCNELEEIKEAEGQLENLPTTEKESVINSRVGQGLFRKQLIDLWGACSVTSCPAIPLLKASHIKPWRDSNNVERLDVFNGFLLTPNLDSSFDTGLITFDNTGAIVISSALDVASRGILGIHPGLVIKDIKKENLPYLEYHRNYVYQS
ncbi:DUF2002 family protein [Methylocucumis oryzae]|uniref:HNH nuclease domain-containing protein n=1 Tax=Methylocucumis oryzae TaxID=1632867 RepID=A0A0F3IIK6_9GAMM|nr:DUF2002 family protein [Methylocucumis oryzae]KJV06556.1 hypothetical protein VZ94_10505 [Methylocucumis oryzae]